MHAFADHPAARTIRTPGTRRPWWLLGVVAVAALVIGTLGGWAITNATKANSAPAAESVARQLALLLTTAHGNLYNADRSAALFAKDAVATDAPSGGHVSGREQIRTAVQYVIGQGGAWKLDHVLANDRWAAVVITRTRDSRGHKVSTPWVWLLNIRNGQIVSETDIYDAHSWRW